MIFQNGALLAQGSQFSLEDVEVVTATVDIEEVRSYSGDPSRGNQATQALEYPRIEVDFALSTQGFVLDTKIRPSPPREAFFHPWQEEIALGPACWLWDYLRRSRQAGFFIPLSGGIDSASTAVIVFSMCRVVMQAVEDGNQQVIKDVKMICAEGNWMPSSPQELCGKLLHTAYMGTEKNSTKETRQRAKDLGKAIGSYHIDFNIDNAVSAMLGIFTAVTNLSPRYLTQGGSAAEGLSLQNLQARLRFNHLCPHNVLEWLTELKGWFSRTCLRSYFLRSGVGKGPARCWFYQTPTWMSSCAAMQRNTTAEVVISTA